MSGSVVASSFGSPSEKLVNPNIAVPPYYHGQIVSRPMSPEQLQRNRWIVKKLREKHFPDRTR